MRRVPLRCPHCAGNVYLEVDLAGHVADLKCLLCGRVCGD